MSNFSYRMIEDESLAIMSYEGESERVVIPDYGGQLTVIYDDIFKGHKELKKVIIPSTVTNIGGFVFDGCKNLREIELPENLQEMWQYAFARSGIETINIPGTVSRIIPFTFMDCKNLKSVICHSGIKKICAWAFQGCTSLEVVTVPADITIDEKAFEGCNPDLVINRLYAS